MTTVQPMLSPERPARRTPALRAGRPASGCPAGPRRLSFTSLTLLLALALALPACAPRERSPLSPPDVLVAPYGAPDDVLWAVAPLTNESGVSSVDTGVVADALVHAIDEVRGLSCLPLNRTLAAMRARNIRSVSSPAEARALAQALGADGLIVGTVTAYDPYDPPKLGLKLALFARAPGARSAEADPLRLQLAYTESDRALAARYASAPVASVSRHLDAQSHDTLFELRRFATGRHDPDAALGWRSYTASMDLYTRFAAYAAVSRLIEQERLRVARPATAAAEATPTR